MSFFQQELEQRVNMDEMIAAGICACGTWNLLFLNPLLATLLRQTPGQCKGGSFLAELALCGFNEVEEIFREDHKGEFVALHHQGDVYLIRWRDVAETSALSFSFFESRSQPFVSEKERPFVRLVTMVQIPVTRISRIAELPWQELSVMLDSIHDGIWVIDANGITLRINKAMERIADLRAEEVIGKHVTEPMHKGRFETCVTLRALIEKRVVTMFDDYANGKRCLNTSTPIFDENGNVWRVIASIRDMTELESLQRKLSDLETETLAYKARLQNLETEMEAGFVGHSVQLRRLRREAAKAARTEATTLILGETGTGKTLTAKAIHDMSPRRNASFIAINCGAIPSGLMESELFGYEKGAFTGAAKGGKPGMFELAHKGTLLLDEIGELTLPMQAKLLQVLDGHPFHRVGGTKTISVDVRVLAATNKPLTQMVEKGQFREDLFYRLRVLTVAIPPLRERPDDIPILALHFLQEISAKNELSKKFDPQVLNCFLTYPWPGNIRELRAIVQSLATMSEGETITLQDLPSYMQVPSLHSHEGISFRQSLRDAVAELERSMIMTALTETGSTYKAARRLKVSQSTIVRKAQRYKIGLVEVAHAVLKE